ncbi:glycoside hydrolase family 108 protein [Orenia marismortui]|uniref:glycoside hydrolase family 108 protein n=1 Tax=Orenia marismortui TaxID=46469 RepID=UPI000378B0CC|nr:glycosyl hydrolase 108 family protein [Orenia marismortui]
MNKVFEKAFQKILRFEGRYSNEKYDHGGKTKYGISEEVAKRLGYDGDIEDLTIVDAKKIYYNHYWKNLNYHKIEDIDIAIESFDQAVNMGPRTATKHLQEAYNLLSDNEIEVDGIVGAVTLDAINNCPHPFELLQLLNIIQGIKYIEIVKKDKKQKKFIKGWLKRTLL